MRIQCFPGIVFSLRTTAPALLSPTGLLGALLALLLDPVHVEGFVLERPGEQSTVSLRLRLNGLAKSRMGGRDEVWVILPRAVHDLMEHTNSSDMSTYRCWL